MHAVYLDVAHMPLKGPISPESSSNPTKTNSYYKDCIT